MVRRLTVRPAVAIRRVAPRLGAGRRAALRWGPDRTGPAMRPGAAGAGRESSGEQRLRWSIGQFRGWPPPFTMERHFPGDRTAWMSSWVAAAPLFRRHRTVAAKERSVAPEFIRRSAPPFIYRPGRLVRRGGEILRRLKARWAEG